MTRRKRMVLVDAWLRSRQTLMEYADGLGVDVLTCLGWIVEYGPPAVSSKWIPVRMRDEGTDPYPLDETLPGEGLKPAIHPSLEIRPHWVPVIIRERA
jgi:hypothetical protein